VVTIKVLKRHRPDFEMPSKSDAMTLAGAAAMLAALYGLLRLPETRHRGAAVEVEPPSEVGVVRNNAVPAHLSSAAKLRVPLEAVFGAAGQLPSQVQMDEFRRYESSTVRHS